jgi:hypothetical protein
MKTIIGKDLRIPMLFMLTAAFLFAFSLSGCKQKKKAAEEQKKELAQDNKILEEDIWVIDEYQINDIPVMKPLKQKAPGAKEKKAAPEGSTREKTTSAPPAQAQKMDEFEVISKDELHSLFMDKGYEAREIEIAVAQIPLEDTQTLIAYTKKGKEKDAVQVVSSGDDGSVDQIIFTDKKAKDVYNVGVGMTGKEVKKLRRNLKKMERDGKVFLYDDTSNILYLMQAKDDAGNEVKGAELDSMSVQAIIWKPTRHELKKEEKEEEEG